MIVRYSLHQLPWRPPTPSEPSEAIKTSPSEATETTEAIETLAIKAMETMETFESSSHWLRGSSQGHALVRAGLIRSRRASLPWASGYRPPGAGASALCSLRQTTGGVDGDGTRAAQASRIRQGHLQQALEPIRQAGRGGGGALPGGGISMMLGPHQARAWARHIY